jgi:transposase-like protein
VLDHQDEYGSQWEAICSVAEKLGPRAETVRLWARRAEADEGRRPGATSDELAELKRLEREDAELRRANDILEAADSLFGRGGARPPVQAVIAFIDGHRDRRSAPPPASATGPPRPPPLQLTTEQGRRLLDEVAAFGRPSPLVVLTGGDPFERGDLVELVAHGRQAGLSMALAPSVTPRATRDRFEQLPDVPGRVLDLDAFLWSVFLPIPAGSLRER